MTVITAPQDRTLIAKPSQRRYSCSQLIPASTKMICSRMPSETTTTRWKISLEKLRTARPPFFGTQAGIHSRPIITNWIGSGKGYVFGTNVFPLRIACMGTQKSPHSRAARGRAFIGLFSALRCPVTSCGRPASAWRRLLPDLRPWNGVQASQARSAAPLQGA